ncbi:MAG: VOC family protein [Polyangiaceae bacterium]|nr:VOC family protein [Polyangiaceae bacterium]MCL4750916.1 VOC family protein [Myxococcales bacterium]
MGHPVNWFQVSGSDGKSLQDFYKKIFAWRMSPSPDGSMMMVAKEEGGIEGGISKSMDGQSGVTFFVSVADIDAHLKKIAKAGGTIAMPKLKLDAGMGFIAGFRDPAGNWIGLWQAGKAPAPKKAAKAAPKATPPAKAKAAPKTTPAAKVKAPPKTTPAAKAKAAPKTTPAAKVKAAPKKAAKKSRR